MSLKNILLSFTLVLLISVIYSEEDLRISQAWFNKHGCPVTNRSFVLDCNDCLCIKAGKSETGGCTKKLCHEQSIDDFKAGKKCPAGEDFFSQCKICKCNDKGDGASCSSTVCNKYYSHVKLN